MEITNYKAIKSVKFLNPEVMAPDAEEKIIALFNDIQQRKDAISDAFMALEEKRNELEDKEKEWRRLQDLIEITYETEFKEEVKGDICIGFNFGTEVNKHIH